MSKGIKRLILGLLVVLVIVISGAIIYINVLLSRINYVPADQVQQTQEQDIASEDSSPEESLADSELNLREEIQQTVLSEEEQRALAEQEKRKNVTNVLLLGVDRRSSSGLSRSDTMLIATLDNNNKKLKLTSLMRDMYVPIPGQGENRINSACSKGGPALLMQTINENFSMDLEYYVLVDFRMFEKIVDKLGGVELELSEGEVAEANDCIAGLNKQQGVELEDGFITKRGGNIRLTGKQALGYARIRHFGDGDYARTSRQFKILKAIMEKFMDIDPIKQQGVLYDVLEYVETNLPKTKIIDLAFKALSIGPSELMHYRLPVEGSFESKKVRGMSVLLPDIPANAKLLHEFVYNATEVEALPGSNTGRGVYHPKTTPTPEIQYLTDQEGNLILDENGNPIPLDFQYLTDEAGNLVLDENGNPIPLEGQTETLPEEESLPDESEELLPDESGEELPEEDNGLIEEPAA